MSAAKPCVYCVTAEAVAMETNASLSTHARMANAFTVGLRSITCSSVIDARKTHRLAAKGKGQPSRTSSHRPANGKTTDAKKPEDKSKGKGKDKKQKHKTKSGDVEFAADAEGEVIRMPIMIWQKPVPC